MHDMLFECLGSEYFHQQFRQSEVIETDQVLRSNGTFGPFRISTHLQHLYFPISREWEQGGREGDYRKAITIRYNIYRFSNTSKSVH